MIEQIISIGYFSVFTSKFELKYKMFFGSTKETFFFSSITAQRAEPHKIRYCLRLFSLPVIFIKGNYLILESTSEPFFLPFSCVSRIDVNNMNEQPMIRDT